MIIIMMKVRIFCGHGGGECNFCIDDSITHDVSPDDADIMGNDYVLHDNRSKDLNKIK